VVCRIFCKFDADKVDKTRKAGEAEGADPENVELAKDNFALILKIVAAESACFWSFPSLIRL
jgi:hypothetical protein